MYLIGHVPCLIIAVDSDRPLVTCLVRNTIHEHSVWVGLIGAELDRFEFLLEGVVGREKGQLLLKLTETDDQRLFKNQD